MTRVGPATPCGELMRRYWQPVCLSADLKDVPERVRILGEDLVAFRDGQGRAGVVFFRCSHRGTSLEYGRVEDRGLRCCYHGWLYDVEGNILEMPLEPANNPFLKQIQHPCYPVREFGGPGLCRTRVHPISNRSFPSTISGKTEGGVLKARMGPRVGGPVNCNWLQAEENLMDALHTFWLHTLHSGTQFPSPVYGMNPDELKYEETEMGMRFLLNRKLPSGKWWELVWEMLMPLNIHLVYTDEPKTERVRAVTHCVPVDDTHQLGASIRWVPGWLQMPTNRRGANSSAPAGRKDASYEYTQRHPDDKEAVESQGPNRAARPRASRHLGQRRDHAQANSADGDPRDWGRRTIPKASFAMSRKASVGANHGRQSGQRLIVKNSPFILQRLRTNGGEIEIVGNLPSC